MTYSVSCVRPYYCFFQLRSKSRHFKFYIILFINVLRLEQQINEPPKTCIPLLLHINMHEMQRLLVILKSHRPHEGSLHLKSIVGGNKRMMQLWIINLNYYFVYFRLFFKLILTVIGYHFRHFCFFSLILLGYDYPAHSIVN
jgi:hypothetical protein